MTDREHVMDIEGLKEQVEEWKQSFDNIVAEIEQIDGNFAEKANLIQLYCDVKGIPYETMQPVFEIIGSGPDELNKIREKLEQKQSDTPVSQEGGD